MSRVKTPSPYAAIRFTLGRASSCKILLHLNTMKVLNKFLKNGTGNYVEGVVNGRTVGQSDRHHAKPHTIHLRLPPGTSVP